MSSEKLHIIGARENNLKEIDLDIPHNALTVVTGLSGSGKSSLAFDSVYAEGQRRYIETFSPYTRQFLDKIKKPEITSMDNVRPSLAIQQRNKINSSRSSVGSLTSCNDFLKLLFVNLGTPACPSCGVDLKIYSANDVAVRLLEIREKFEDAYWLVCTVLEYQPFYKEKKKSISIISEVLLEQTKTALLKAGFSRVYTPKTGEITEVAELTKEYVESRESLFIIIDRIRSHPAKAPSKKTLLDSLVQARDFALQGLPSIFKPSSDWHIIQVDSKVRLLTIVQNNEGQKNGIVGAHQLITFPSQFRCPAGMCEVPKARLALFSHNNPIGACPDCKGFGRVLTIDENAVIPDQSKTIKEKAIQCWAGESSKVEYKDLLQFCAEEGIAVDIPWRDLSSTAKDKIFNSKTKSFWGVHAWFQWLEKKTYKMHVRVLLSRYRKQTVCQKCQGSRLKPEALTYKVAGYNLAEVSKLSIRELADWLDQVKLRLPQEKDNGSILEILASFESRVTYLNDLGLGYLTLERQAKTLSGGETQRVNLASALGSDLVSTQFVLDEPSVGLHSRDTERLNKSIRALVAKGNSVLVVEHDPECIAEADHVIELGPKAGKEGGEIIYNGSAEKWPGIAADEEFSDITIESESHLTITNANKRNLKNISFTIPLQRLVTLAGVSGSGKSTVVHEVIAAAYQQYKQGIKSKSSSNLVAGFEDIGELVVVDQSSLSKSPRSVLASYVGFWDQIRDFFASTPEASAIGLTKSHFSFNVDGGRCPACKGAGFIREDMQFLSDVYVPCEVCLGERFQPSVLSVKYQGKNISEVLKMTADESAAFFSDHKDIWKAARLLSTVGLGHLTLGHALSELSGGESQRLKLIPYLTGSEGKEKSLFIFDEPTTGLHYRDVKKLLELFKKIVAEGHSVVCIEHNLSVIIASDWVIELGPEGGALGGELLFSGTPRQLIDGTQTPTSKYTKEFYTRIQKKKKIDVSGYQKEDQRKETRIEEKLIVKGAREHNLKNIDVEIPQKTFVAITGVSGSGKSTLAKDIIFAEGQRRYLDCLSPYARQYIKELSKPDLDEIHNVQPTICVYQHTFQPSKLSTVGTLSEVYNFLRLLYAKTGIQYCPDHPEQEILPFSAAEIAAAIKQLPSNRVRILASVIKSKKGTHREVFERAAKQEITEVRVDGVTLSTSMVSMGGGLEKSKVHSIEFVLGKFSPATLGLDLIEETVSQALALSGGTVIVATDKEELVYSTERNCPHCKRGFYKPDPEDLSFSSSRGKCKKCQGFGELANGKICPECEGSRLTAIGRNIKINGMSISELSLLTCTEVKEFLGELEIANPIYRAVSQPILHEMLSKLVTLISVGLGDLTLNRSCSSLSGGELQRLRLAAAIGCSLTGAMFIFDEPSAGLHPFDNKLVLKSLRDITARGNSLLMIEHDKDSILAADYIVDIGPEGGKKGGQLCFAGKVEEFIHSEKSPTAVALREDLQVQEIARVEMNDKPALHLSGIKKHNLKALDLIIPLHSLVVVGGVSGAGKSTLVHSVIKEMIAEDPERTEWKSEIGKIVSSLPFTRVIEIDQKPIGINSRSTPSSYLKIFDEIRNLFALTPEAKSRGWTGSYFSYNSGKGRCPDCKGLGEKKLEMSFLPDARVLCDSCEGKRYNDETLSVTYLGLSIEQALNLTFEEGKQVFANHRNIHRRCHLACELGVGYLSLGQSSATLSGGESQRLKLVDELSRPQRGHSLYVLDEPTIGLHRSDVQKLIKVLKDLVARGDSVVIIEHDPDVVASAQWFIELGPAAGEDGGLVIFQGEPAGLRNYNSPWATILATQEVVEATQTV